MSLIPRLFPAHCPLPPRKTSFPYAAGRDGSAVSRQRILELFSTCQGNLVRVREDLTVGGASVAHETGDANCSTRVERSFWFTDLEGYVALHTNRYSVPVDWIGRRVEVR